jgi:hypothetical protein
MRMSNNSNSLSVLDDKISLVSVSIGTFGGYRRATREQIASLGGNLPACKAITEGSIKVYKTEALAVFHSIRRNLIRKIARHGVKALGSSTVFAFPSAELQEITAEIASAEQMFFDERANLDSQYDDIFERHVAENREAEAVIRLRKFDRAEAISKLVFASSVFRISPLVREGEDAELGVMSIVAGLARQLFEEVASEMEELAKNQCFVKNARVGQKTLRPLRAVVAKMQGLTFLDDTIDGAIKFVNDTLADLPKQGYIEDTAGAKPFSALRRLVELMSDANELVNAASRVKNGIPYVEVLFPRPAPAAPAPVVGQRQASMPAQPVSTALTGDPAGLPPLPIATAVAAPRPAARRPAVPIF